MSSSSVSFRISRHTEDLAETLHALSQRLVAMEQRLVALEGQLLELRRQPQENPADLEGIAQAEAHIERLLLDCRQLLGDQSPGRDASAFVAGRAPEQPASVDTGAAVFQRPEPEDMDVLEAA